MSPAASKDHAPLLSTIHLCGVNDTILCSGRYRSTDVFPLLFVGTSARTHALYKAGLILRSNHNESLYMYLVTYWYGVYDTWKISVERPRALLVSSNAICSIPCKVPIHHTFLDPLSSLLFLIQLWPFCSGVPVRFSHTSQFICPTLQPSWCLRFAPHPHILIRLSLSGCRSLTTST